MFGIGRKKEDEKEIGKGEEKGTEDEIQFDFEEDDRLPFDDEDFDADDAEVDELVAGGPHRAVPQRTVILLGLLLLLVIGGGGYYYLNRPSPPPSPAKPAAPVKKKVAVQPAPTPSAPAAVAKTVSTESVAAVSAKIPPATKTVGAPVVKVTPAAVVTTTQVEKKEVSPSVHPAASQPFTLVAGVFVSQKNEQKIVKTIRRLGYTQKVETTYSMVPMTRLLLGIYEPDAAAKRYKELVSEIPGLFTLKDGDNVALYAGSYLSQNMARDFADKLHQQGILADEETISLRMAMKKISFGSFPTREAAEKAAKDVAAAGLSVEVVKR